MGSWKAPDAITALQEYFERKEKVDDKVTGKILSIMHLRRPGRKSVTAIFLSLGSLQKNIQNQAVCQCFYTAISACCL